MTVLRRHGLTLVVTAIAAVTASAWAVWSGTFPTLADSYEVRAMVPSAVTLAEGANVRISGVSVGHVTEVERDGAAVRVGMEIDDEHAPLPADSRVAVRLRSLVGENYLEGVPGRSRTTLDDGATLALSRADDYVDIDEILSVLKGDTRERARALVQDLGDTVGGRGKKLNGLLDEAAGFVDEGSNIMAILDDDREVVSRLVENVGTLGRSVETRGGELRSFARDARTTFGAIARRDDALRDVVAELPSTLRRARSTAGVLRATTRDVAPVLDDVAAAVTELDPAVRSLGPAATAGRGLTRELSAAAPPLTGVLNRLERTSGPVRTILPGVRRVLCEARPALDYLTPYAKDVTSLISGMASATNYYDASGHAARLYLAIGADTPTIKASDELTKLLNAGILGNLTLTGWNPYPKPGEAGDTTTGSGQAGPNDVTGRTYTRVKAAC